MGALKQLELFGKYLLAIVAALLLWRPGRRMRARERLQTARRILLVRVDDRVGEALLMTPLLTTLKALKPAPVVHVLLHKRAVRVLEGHPQADAVLGLDRRALALGPLAPGIRPLRRAQYDAVVNCANWEVPSVTAALVARLCGPRSAVVGPAVWPVGALHDVRVTRKEGTRGELEQRLHLLTPLTQAPPARSLSFRTPRVGAPFASLLAGWATRRTVVVNPGGRLGWRRVPPATFAAATREVLAAGRAVVVTWGPGEEPLARAVVDGAPGAELAPPTNLDELAAMMQSAGVVICNNTGPMHLAVATGAATLAFFLRIDPERWGYPDAPHRMVELAAEAASEEQWATRARQETAAFLANLG